MEQPTSRRFSFARILWDNAIIRLLLIAIVIFAAFSIALPGKFCTVRNLQSMAMQFPEFGILAIAIVVTMLINIEQEHWD